MSRRFLLIDDEPLALSRLARLIRTCEPSATCVTAEDGFTGIERLNEGSWEAVFLDVEMPGLSGFEVLRRVPPGVPLPPIIFCTAYSRYALQAFEEAAIDYLVKPTDEERVSRALARTSRTHVERARLSELERMVAGGGHSSVHTAGHLATRVGDRVVQIAWSEILYLRADNKLTTLVALDREVLLDKSLDALEAELPIDVFFRCHRAALVNLQQVISFDAGAEPYLTLRQNHTVPVSRRRKQAIKRRLIP